jgi:hypothetical protein
MKPLLALALLAVLGFAAAGCGSAKKAVSGGPRYIHVVTLHKKAGSGSITVMGTTTIPNVATGARIKCKGWPGRGVKVPAPGGEADAGGGTATPSGTGSSSRNMRLTHLENGSVTVACMRSR